MAIKHRSTLGNIWILEVDADPSGVITAPKGSIAMDSTNGEQYRSTGGTTWSLVTRFPAALTFDPSTAGTCELWYRADLGLIVDGFNNVTSWDDQEANGGTPSLTPPGTAPVKTAAALNGLPVVTFSNGRVRNTSITSFTDAYVAFLVMKSTDAGAGGTDRYILSMEPGSGPFFLRQLNGGTVLKARNVEATGWAINTWKYVTVYFHGSTGFIRINGVQTGGPGNTSDGELLTNLAIGGYSDGDVNKQWQGGLAEVLIYRGAGITIPTVENYLQTKYGL